MQAANLAGKAINLTKTTGPHAISYPITTHFGVPHGHAVALSLGRCFYYTANAEPESILDPRGKEYLQSTMSDIATLFGASSLESFPDDWATFMMEVGLENSPIKLGIITEADIELIVSNVNVERLSNHPVQLSKALIRNIFSENEKIL